MKNIILITGLLLILTGCTDAFLATDNKNSVDINNFLESETDLKTAVNAAYTPLAHSGMFGLEYFRRQNCLDPYIWNENPGIGYDALNFSAVDFNRTGYISTWSDLYIGLFRTSDILFRMTALKGVVSDTKYVQYEAQLKALRGMYYFYLVTWFNSPVYYDETNVPSDFNISLKNGTPEQFWTKLEEDLMFAASNLPPVWDATETGRITSGAANAQLGKALLYKHYHYYLRFNKATTAEGIENMTKAKAALKRVMDSGSYELMKPLSQTKEDYQAALLSNFSYVAIPVGTNIYKAENNKESVWEIQFNDNDRSSPSYSPGSSWGGNLLYAFYSPRGYRNYEIDPTLWEQYETTGAPIGYDRDPRAYSTCFLDGDLIDWRVESGYKIPFSSTLHTKTTVSQFNLYNGISPSKAIGLKKYNYPQFYEKGETTNSAPFNVRVLRYADVLLMYAETAYLLNADADETGLSALNDVRKRAGMPEITVLTPETIIHERDVELATEGHRYNDIIRWSFDQTKFKVDLNVLFKNRFDIKKHQYFPIPQEEIDVNNGQLIQNNGW